MDKYLDPKRYCFFIICKIISLTSPVIKIWEKSQCKKYAEASIKHQPMFIIGAPRTGSTILYQTLTNQLDVLYIDNLACRFNKNLFFGFWLSNLFFKQKAHNCFSSNHGSTKGLHSPSECGSFWYRWLPRDRHFINHDDVTDKMVKEIREEITAITNKYGKPVVFKNLNAGQRLRFINKAFPNAKIIFLRRDPRFVIRSILKAREKLGVDVNSWWSVMPPNVEELMGLSESVKCAAQVYFLEKQISDDLNLFPQNNIKVIHYKNLNQFLLQGLAKWIGVKPKEAGLLPVFEKDCFSELAREEQEYLDGIITSYPFEKDLFF
ncbi:sulfotransferase [Amphritea sp. 1_MG-2023]|uniref:sulfotransferase n=1 Tax=Amphritea sp. 1_MG-2023 TaxID=3062670 RepID=UPI0026E47846|nr:sulfotransferase [Amphritea sp. 1_MG-2023]MDO6563998.1 sulfotransferase [Amphritea sp. 1_MG-2023]